MNSCPSVPPPLLAEPRPYSLKSPMSDTAYNSTAFGTPPESGPSMTPVIIKATSLELTVPIPE